MKKVKSFNISIISIMVFLNIVGIIVNWKTKKIYYDNQDFIDNISLNKYNFIIELCICIILSIILFVLKIIAEGIIRNENIDVLGLGIMFPLLIFWSTLMNILYLSLWKNGCI